MDALKKLANIFCRGTYQGRATDGTLSVQQLSGEVNSSLPAPQPYGFASKGISGKTYTICNGGERDSGVIILQEVAGAPTLADGEVAVWNTAGAVITMKANGNIELNGSSFGGLIKIDALTTKLNAHISEYNGHQHNAGVVVTDGPLVPAATFSAADYENEEVLHG